MKRRLRVFTVPARLYDERIEGGNVRHRIPDLAKRSVVPPLWRL
jgi:hypothetical protein